jgi:hypothetical protein
MNNEYESTCKGEGLTFNFNVHQIVRLYFKSEYYCSLTSCWKVWWTWQWFYIVFHVCELETYNILGGPSWSWSYGSCMYNYLCNQCECKSHSGQVYHPTRHVLHCHITDNFKVATSQTKFRMPYNNHIISCPITSMRYCHFTRSWSYGSCMYNYLCNQCECKSHSGQVYSIHYVIKFVSDIRQVDHEGPPKIFYVSSSHTCDRF